MEEKNTQSSTVIDVCLIGIRGELLASSFWWPDEDCEREELKEPEGDSVRWLSEGGGEEVVTGGISGDEASFGSCFTFTSDCVSDWGCDSGLV